jgi:hypothetical protein
MDDVIRLDNKLGRTATEKEINQAVKKGEVKELGFKAIPTQRALGREIPGRMQAAGETIFGKARREQGIIAYNMAALNQLKRKIADQKAKLDEYSIFSETDSKVISELKAKRTALEKANENVNLELNKLMNDLASETGGFSSAILQSKKELGKNIQDTISDAYQTIQNNHRTAYGKINDRLRNFNPNFKIDTSDISRYIKEVLNEDFLIAARADDTNFKIITALVNGLEERGNKVNLKELVDLRKNVKAEIYADKLGGGSQRDLVEKVYKLLDEKINNLPNEIPKKIKNNTKELSDIIKDLKAENKLYYKNHLPFDKAVVQKIMNDTKIDADDVYDAVFGINEAGDMKAFIQAMPEAQRLPVRQKLLRRYMQEKSKAAVADPVTGIINPAELSGKIPQLEATT